MTRACPKKPSPPESNSPRPAKHTPEPPLTRSNRNASQHDPFALTAALLVSADRLGRERGGRPRNAERSAAATERNQKDFEIIMESPQPEGWPEPGPAFEITLKHYPAYRAAVKEGGNGFWPLFRHISEPRHPHDRPRRDGHGRKATADTA